MEERSIFSDSKGVSYFVCGCVRDRHIILKMWGHFANKMSDIGRSSGSRLFFDSTKVALENLGIDFQLYLARKCNVGIR